MILKMFLILYFLRFFLFPSHLPLHFIFSFSSLFFVLSVLTLPLSLLFLFLLFFLFLYIFLSLCVCLSVSPLSLSKAQFHQQLKTEAGDCRFNLIFSHPAAAFTHYTPRMARLPDAMFQLVDSACSKLTRDTGRWWWAISSFLFISPLLVCRNNHL